MKREYGVGLMAALLAIWSSMGEFAVCKDRRERSGPNIVFLLADDLGWTGLGCFGSDFYETPNLDGLAAAGTKFTNAYAACTVCSPTRASIMTGMYPARLKCTDFIAGQNRPFARMKIPAWTKQLESRYVTVAEVLQTAGYRTLHVGKWHLNGRGTGSEGTDPISQGFDVSIEKPANARGYFIPAEQLGPAGNAPSERSVYVTDWLTEQACQAMEDCGEQPFFLYFAYHVPHTPIQGRPDLVAEFEKKVRIDAIHRNPAYAAMVASLDQSAGRILRKLDELGIAQDTVVIFTSDNGGLTQRYGKHDGFTENLPLRRGKGSAYEGGVRVPAIVRWPGVSEAGSVCDRPIMTIDYYPTILEMARLTGDAEHNASVDGESLVALLRSPTALLERDLYWHYPHYHAGGDGPYSAIRSGSMRLIEFHENQQRYLYDLSTDPGEQRDLSEQMPDVAAQMTDNLHRWRLSVGAQMPTMNADFDPDRQTQVKAGR